MSITIASMKNAPPPKLRGIIRKLNPVAVSGYPETSAQSVAYKPIHTIHSSPNIIESFKTYHHLDIDILLYIQYQ